MKKYTQLESIKELVKADHVFLSPEGVRSYTEPFGFKGRLRSLPDTRSQFKGLTLNGINPKTGKEYVEGDTALGNDAHLVACEIADHLGIKYADMFGVGSQLRSACGAVQKHLEKLD